MAVVEGYQENQSEAIPFWYQKYLDLMCIDRRKTDITNTIGAVLVSTKYALECLDTFKPQYSEEL